MNAWQRALAFATVFLSLPLAVQAQATDWSVDVTLASGGSITGSFVYDPSNPNYRGYSDIQLTALSSVVGNDSSFAQLEDAGPNGFLILNGDATTAIDMSWGGSLAGAPVGDSFGVNGNYGTFLHFGPNDPIAFGTVTSVPEPDVLGLLACSLAALVVVATRKSRRLQAPLSGSAL